MALALLTGCAGPEEPGTSGGDVFRIPVTVQTGAAYAQTAATQTSEAGGSVTHTASGILSLAAAGGVQVKAENIVISADSKLTVKAGGCTITLTPASATVKAKGKLDLRGAKGINNATHKAGP